MAEGYHHTNDMLKVVPEHLPEAKKVMEKRLDFTQESSEWFKPLNMTHDCLCVYKMEYKD